MALPDAPSPRRLLLRVNFQDDARDLSPIGAVALGIQQAQIRNEVQRIVAICRVSGEDLGAIMVREGLAWAVVRYSRDCVDEYAKVAAERRGVHAHGCQPAWEWRAQQRRAQQ